MAFKCTGYRFLFQWSSKHRLQLTNATHPLGRGPSWPGNLSLASLCLLSLQSHVQGHRQGPVWSHGACPPMWSFVHRIDRVWQLSALLAPVLQTKDQARAGRLLFLASFINEKTQRMKFLGI